MKIAVVTPYFPTSAQKYRGHSTYQTLKQLQQWAEVEVFCPLATYPNWLHPRNFEYLRADLNYCPPLLKAHYFEYPALPVISRPLNGAVCAHYLEPKLWAAGADLVLNYWLYPEGYAAVRVAHKLGIPAIVFAIGSDLNRIPDSITRWLTRRTVQSADYVITISKQLAERAISLGASADRTRTIANGCDSAVFHPADRGQARAQMGIRPEAALVLFVGRLEVTKGVFELLQAVHALLFKRPNLHLVCVGDGTARHRLETEAIALGVRQHVTLAGTCDSAGVVQWLAAADVFTLPSYAEGCPNVVIEALNCGRPVVACHVGAIPEMVDQNCGILVPPRNSKALARGLDAALSATWNQDDISSRGRRSWDDVASETLEVCETVLAVHLEAPRRLQMSEHP